MLAAGIDVQRANLAYTVVRSPVDGYVVTRDLEQGATVVPGLPIFTVADSSVIWVSANIDEREVGGLRVGQPATITRPFGSDAEDSRRRHPDRPTSRSGDRRGHRGCRVHPARRLASG